MTWIDNDGGFKAHRKHWVNKSRREGRGGTREEAGGRSEGEEGRRKDGG